MNFDHTYHVPGARHGVLLDSGSETTRGCGPVRVTKAEDLTDEELIRYGFDVEKIRNRQAEKEKASEAVAESVEPIESVEQGHEMESDARHGKGKRGIKDRFSSLFKSPKKAEKMQKSRSNGNVNSTKSNSRPCIVDGVRYDTIAAAAKGSGLNRSTLGHALKAGRPELAGRRISYDEDVK